jgi:hypothetical protein
MASLGEVAAAGADEEGGESTSNTSVCLMIFFHLLGEGTNVPTHRRFFVIFFTRGFSTQQQSVSFFSQKNNTLNGNIRYRRQS